MRHLFAILLITASALSLKAGNVAAAATLVPYCRGQLDVDGDIADWPSAEFAAAIVETAGSQTENNRLDAALCWDSQRLYAAFRVFDADVIEAPISEQVSRFHLYDSLQVYLDPIDDSDQIMNRDDIDLLLLADGRSGVLRGDELLRQLEAAAVPQRESAPLTIAFATRRTPLGWNAELAIPFAAMAIEAERGRQLRMDLAMNDRLVGDASNAQGRVMPRSWSGATDFGYPSNWRRLQLVGEPPLLTRMALRYGLARLLAATSLGIVTMLAILFVLWSHQQRRRLRALRSILHGLQSRKSSETMPTIQPVDTDPITLPTAQPSDTLATDPRDSGFCHEVFGYVRAQCASRLTPLQIAAHFNVSLRTLQRRLRSGLDTSPLDLILLARLEKSRELLLQGHRVSAAAEQAGFEDMSYFSRKFKAMWRVSPSSLRTREVNPRDDSPH